MPTAMLQAHDLACIRGDRLLFSELSLEVSSGEGLLVSGPNGSGKTSLLRILCGLSEPETGEVCWGGTDLRQDRAAFLADVAYVGHANGMKSDLTLIENLRVTRALHRSTSAATPEQSLADVGLDALAREPAGTLSAGQGRRLALARLLVTAASLWVLDEPFNALDKQAVDRIEAIIARHLDRGGLVVLTSHQPLQTLDGRLAELRLAA